MESLSLGSAVHTAALALAGVRSFLVSESRIDALRAKAAKLGRRSAKLGLAPIAVREICTEIETRETLRGEETRTLYRVTVEGSAPIVAGWKFYARIEHHEIGNIVSRAPGCDSFDVSAYRSVRAHCDHCKLARRRIDTFVIAQADGVMRQIGRNCLASYIGTTDAENALRLWSFLYEIERSISGEDDDSEGSSGGGWKRDISVANYLAYACATVRLDGWVSRKVAGEYEGKRATADAAHELISGPGPDASYRTKIWHEERQPTAADRERAAAVIAYGATLTGPSDYEQNLRVALGVPYVGRNGGLVASAVGSYQRHVEGLHAAAQRAAAPKAGHWGTVGKRGELPTLTVAMVRHIEGNYGVTTLVAFETADGFRFKWFASGSQDFAVGAQYTGKGTVKDHGEYKGRQETTLSRCALTKVETVATAAE